MASVRLVNTSSEGSASLSFLDAQFKADRSAGSDAYWMECQVSLEVDGESTVVGLSMIQPYREDTLTFFDALSSKPDTWLGAANWYSEHLEVNIDAQGRGNGLVALRVELRQFAHLDPVSVGEIVMSYGDLRQFFWSFARFLRAPYGQPGSHTKAESPLGRWSFANPTDASRGR